MIIGIDGHMIGDHSGGNESFYSNILKAMKVNSDDNVILFLKKGIDASPYENKFRIVRFKEGGSFKRNFFELNRLCKKYKVQVLHTQYFIPFFRKYKTVCTIHDICFEHYKNIFTKKEYFRQKLLIPYAARHSDYIFTVSNNAKEDIARHYSIDKDRILVTYNAVNPIFRVLTKDEINEDELRSKFGIGDGRYILSVGNLQPRKNLPRLIEAFNSLTKKGFEDIKLVIVGKKAWMYSDILKAVSSDNNRVILTDYVTEKDLVRLYNAATCFIYPSFFEGFGIPPLEAMACGTPVAVAKATSLPEVVGDAGLYFDPFDVKDITNQIIRLLTDEKKAVELSKKGLQRAKKFSWAESAKVIYQTYHKVK